MATPLSATRVLAILKAEGITVQEFRSWRTHNRNHVGAFDDVNGVMIHHTVTSADDSSVALCYDGHSTLPGPLCHGVGRNDGRIALVGHGRANHAGLGDPDVLNAVINEWPTLPPDNQATVDGNRRFYGLEIVNLGNGSDTYPWVQYVAAVKWATAHCRAHGWSERSVIGHKEWQPGKIDPHGPVIGPDGKKFDFSMDRFRADVKAALALPAGRWQGGTQQEEWEMADFRTELVAALKDQEVRKLLVTALFRTDDVIDSPPEDQAGGNLHWWGQSYFRETWKKLTGLEAKVDSVQTGGVDLEALAERVADKLAERLRD